MWNIFYDTTEVLVRKEKKSMGVTFELKLNFY